MFRRNYLGLDISHNGLRAVSIGRQGTGVTLNGWCVETFSEDLLAPVFLSAQVKQPKIFIDAVRTVLEPLCNKEKRIGVSLPNTAGCQYLLDIDTPFETYSEGLEIVRWRLKSLLPAQFNCYKVDYQHIENTESKTQRVLVSVIGSDLLSQYEELLSQAGFNPSLIDFQCMNVYSAYRSKVDLAEDLFLVSVDHDQFSILAFADHRLRLCRTKTLVSHSEQLFRELNRSLVNYRQNNEGIGGANVYLHSVGNCSTELKEIVAASFERNVELLSAPVPLTAQVSNDSYAGDCDQTFAAAFGVAKRLVKRITE